MICNKFYIITFEKLPLFIDQAEQQQQQIKDLAMHLTVQS
jgi:hypothetical protein